MLTPCWLRKCSSSSFLPCTPSTFQQARRRSLHQSVLLGRLAIFGHEQNNGLQNSLGVGCPCGEGGYGHEEPLSQLHTCLEGKAIEEIRNFPEWGGGTLGGDHQVGCCGCGGHSFDTRSCFLLWLPSSQLSRCYRFRLRLLRPSRLPAGCGFRCLLLYCASAVLPALPLVSLQSCWRGSVNGYRLLRTSKGLFC